MYDVLVYLFENCQQAEIADDRDRVARKLSAAGFEDADISEALHWLAGVARVASPPRGALPDSRTTFRAFAPRELAKLDAQCRGFIITLEQSGILTAETREQMVAADQQPPLLIPEHRVWNQKTPTSHLLAEDLFSAAHPRLPN